MQAQVDFSMFDAIIANPYVVIAGIFLFFAIIIIGLVFLIRNYTLKHGNVATAFKKKVLLVSLPNNSDDDNSQSLNNQQIQEKISLAETLFSTIAGLKAEKGFMAWFYGRQDDFSLELVAQDGKISFYIAVPLHLQHYLEEQINAQYPTAFIEEIADYNIFAPKSIIAGKLLIFARSYIFPIKTYKKFDGDPLNALTNALSKVSEEDSAAIQIVIRSARSSWHNLGVKVASKMQQGKKLESALREAQGGLGAFFASSKKKDGQSEAYRLSPMEEDVVKGLEEKSSKAGVDANIRIVVSSENQFKVDQYLHNLTNAFTQFNLPKFGNSFKIVNRKLNTLVRNFIYRNFDNRRKILLNTEELASLYHLPIPLVNMAPNIRWLESRKASAPQNMPKEGLLLGKNSYRGQDTLVRIKEEDRRRHMYIIGMTGTGKSYFMSSLTMQDIKAGKGICYIDPHGDDLENILARIPKERAEDVVILDPSDTSRPIGLNLLEFTTQQDKTFAINEIMAIFDKLYDLKATGGPMFEQYFKNAAALIMEDPESGSTLMEISRVLSDESFRNYKLSKCKSQLVKDFWEKEALKAGGDAALANMVPYITSKMAPFISNDFIRPIISQQKSTIDFEDIMNTNKILLVKLAKGKIGDLNANLLGMLIVGKILMAALKRGDMAAEDRKDFFLYIDEFQNFLTDSVEIILSEARKYKLCLTVAHQYLGQLIKGGDTKFKDAIFGNVGTKISFRIGVDDAEILAKEYAPTFREADFLNVPALNCFVKLLIDGANPIPFNMKTFSRDELPIEPENKDLAKAIRELSRLKYGKDLNMVEAEILSRQKKGF